MVSENTLLWELVFIADECGVDFAQYYEDEFNEYADDIKDMGYWEALLYCMRKRIENEDN